MARARATMEEFIREKMDLEALQWIKQLNEDTRKASLGTRKRLITMTEFVEERRQQHYNALVQVEEHLEHMEEEMVEMQTSFEDLHGQIAELGGPKDDSHEDDMMEEMKDELMTQVEPRQDTLQALVGKPHEDVANVSMIMEELDEQVVPGSNTSKALMRMEETHLRSLHGDMIVFHGSIRRMERIWG